MIFRTIAMAGFLAGAAAAFAGPTALIVMPIADLLGHREAIYQFSATGNEANIDKAHYFDHGLEVGFDDVAECGFDNDLLGNTVLNFKIQLYHSKDPAKFAISAGMQNIGLITGQPDKYLVGRYDMKQCRLHMGYLYNDRSRLMLGIDGPLPKGFSYCADYVSGPNSYAWVGLTIPVPIKGVQIMLSGGIPTNHQTGIQHQVLVTYGFKL